MAQLGDRSLFPALGDRVYLAHAAISPPSTAVVTACNAVLDDYAAHGAGAWQRHRDQRDVLRGDLAALVGAAPDEIALVASTSQGILDVALCLAWRPGERVVLFEGEFPANVTAWQQAARDHDLQLCWHRVADFDGPEARGLARLEAELVQGGVRLVAVSAVQFQSGLAMPLAEIAALCHRFGAELFVDAIQAVGVVPLDVAALGVDYLCAGSHKWLMGPEGAGFLYVRRERQAHLRPRVSGWLSHQDCARFLFEGEGHLRYDRPIRPGIDFLEFGAMNALGFAALGASVALLRELGVAAVYAHVQALHDALEAPLARLGLRSARSRDPARRSGILAFRPPEGGPDLDAWFTGFAAHGVDVSTPDGMLRLAPHWPNSAAQMPRVIAAAEAVLAGGAGG